MLNPSDFLNIFLHKFFTFFNNNIENDINFHLIAMMKKHNVLAVGYAVIDDYKMIVSDTISIESRLRVSTDSMFQACSLSKCLTAYAILKLVTEKKFSLDDSINFQTQSYKILENRYSRHTSIRQCLSMTSGLCYGELDSSFPGYLQDQPIPTLKDILLGTEPAHNLPIKIGYQPGSEYHYSGAGYMMLQQLIEEAISQSFSQFMQDEILQPLGMNHSTFDCPINEKHKANVVPGFQSNGTMINQGWENIITSASGGLWSTPTDLATFVLAITNAFLGIDNTVISQSLAEDMLTYQKNSYFGLGISIDGDGNQLNFRKNGHNTGYHNELLMFPRIGKGIVVMANSGNGIILINEFIAFIANKYNWPSYLLNFDE